MPAGRRGRALARERFGEFQTGIFNRGASQRLGAMQSSVFSQNADSRLAELETLLLQQPAFGEQLGATEALMEQEEKQEGWSLPVLGGAKSLLTHTLDLLARPQQAVVGAFLGEQAGEGVGEGFKAGLLGTPEERENYNFATWIERGGMGGFLEDNEWGRNIVGLAIDMVMDPLNVFAFSKARHIAKIPFGFAAQAALQIPGAKAASARALGLTDNLRLKMEHFTPRIGDTTEARLRVAARQSRRAAKELPRTKNNKLSKAAEDLIEAADAIEGKGKFRGAFMGEGDVRAADDARANVAGGLIDAARRAKNARKEGVRYGVERLRRGLQSSGTWESGTSAKEFVKRVSDSSDFSATLSELLMRAKGWEGGELGMMMRMKSVVDEGGVLALQEARKAVKRGQGLGHDDLITHIDDIIGWNPADPQYARRSFMPGEEDVLLSPGGVEKQLVYQQNVQQLHDLGLKNFVGFIETEFGRAQKGADQILGLLEGLSPAGIAEKFLGVLPREDMYLRTMLGGRQKLTNFLSDNPGIKARLNPKAKAFDTNMSLQDMIKSGMETDVFALIAYDMAETRASAIAFQVFDDDFMKSLGLRAISKKTYALGAHCRSNSLTSR